MIGIYKIVNTITGNVYIGKSVNIKHRFNEHINELKHNKKQYNLFFQRSFNKYGSACFKLEIIEECSLDELNSREIYWISYYRNNYPFELYNISNGGDGGKMPDYIIESNKSKISVANKGKMYTKHIGPSNGMYNKHHSQETKQLISLHKKGQVPWNKGKCHSIDTIEKIRISQKGKHHSIESKHKISIKLKGVLKKSNRKWSDTICNQLRNFNLIGISFYMLGNIMKVNSETVRYSVRRFEKENNLPNSSIKYKLLPSCPDVSLEDTPATMKQYEDYISKGTYDEAKE